MIFLDDLIEPDVVLALDRVCDDFEAHLRNGAPTSIETQLAAVPEKARRLVFAELLFLDIAYRHKAGQSVDSADYRERFPDHVELIEDICRRSEPDASAATVAHGEHLAETVHRTTPYIGKYRVVEWLGRGSQGDVFRAVHPSLLGRDVVIKWARASVGVDLQQALLAEGRTLAKLEDPGLVRVYDVDLWQGRLFVVFEYVAGQTLADWMREREPSPREIAEIVSTLAETLDRVHRQGIVHRDIKPANILIDRDGRPRLLDFGLAWLQEEAGAQPMPGVCGTFQYMAPEQARGDGVTPASDQFGLGAVCYELLTGVPPYQGKDIAETWQQARLGQIVPPRERNPRVPAALERICLKSLATDPAQRFGSAAELAAALRRHSRRRTRRAVGLLAAGALVWLAGIAYAILNSAQPQVEAPLPRPLTGDLKLRVWGGADKRGLAIEHPDALPLRNGDKVQLEVELNRPAYVYLVWIDGAGEMQPLYPWNPALGFVGAPEKPEPCQSMRSPEQEKDGWKLEGKSSLETIVLLGRDTPLPADSKLAERLRSLPTAPFRDDFKIGYYGFDRAHGFKKRGIHPVPQPIDDAFLDSLARMRKDFELVRAVRFAHLGD